MGASFFSPRRDDDWNGLAAVPPVDAKIPIERGDTAAGDRLGHADEARVGERHGAIRIAAEQLPDSVQIVLEVEANGDHASLDQIEDLTPFFLFSSPFFLLTPFFFHFGNDSAPAGWGEVPAGAPRPIVM